VKRKNEAEPRPSEAQIQETCSQWLQLDGWRRIRTDMKQLRGMGVQEPGMADDLFIRYDPKVHLGARDYSVADEDALRIEFGDCWAQVLWVEWKRQRGGDGRKALFTKAEKAKIHQVAWHAAERARGGLTVILGEDCPASIEGFQEWYRKSGLGRRKGWSGAPPSPQTELIEEANA